MLKFVPIQDIAVVVMITTQEDGDVHVELEGQLETLLARAQFSDGYLTGSSYWTIPSGGARKPVSEDKNLFDFPGDEVDVTWDKRLCIHDQECVREGWRGTKSALCRCGSSENNPFCDGSHKTLGFKAE